MDSAAKDLLRHLLETPRPSGYEGPVQEVVRSYLAEFADSVETDRHGNLLVALNPGAPVRLMFAGHCDQIGLVVTFIDKEGFIYTQTIGGWDPQQLVGQRMTVWTSKSGAVPAVIARKPIHLLTEAERGKVVEQEELWLDIGAKDAAEAKEVVRIGDPVTLELGYQEMRNDLANGPGMDNASGLWVVIEAFRRAALRKPQCGLYAVSTVQEEIGLRGAKTSAYGIDPQVAVAVDVTHATDCPTVSQKQQGEIALGAGPVIFRGPNMNPGVTERLIDIAEKESLPFQLAALGRAASNDANVLQVSRAGVATGLVCLPNRYMHSAVETVSLNDLDRAADLLAAFAIDLSAEDDFTP